MRASMSPRMKRRVEHIVLLNNERVRRKNWMRNDYFRGRNVDVSAKIVASINYWISSNE